MGFRRTASGLSNQHLFHNVDLVVFTEGGFSLSKHEVYSGKFNISSIDVVFWQNIFEKYRKDLTVKIKALGSKSTLLEVAEDIRTKKITKVVTALDGEFDKLFSRNLRHENILYTYGYSWENDVWCLETIQNVVQELSALKLTGNELNYHYSKFLKDVKIGVYADGYLFWKGGSFFQRKGHLKCMKCDLKQYPSIKKAEIENILSGKVLNRNTLYSFAKRKKIDVHRDCFGHLLADYCYHLIAYFLKKVLQLSPINKVYISRIAIKKSLNQFQPHLNNYYLLMLKSLAT